MHKFLVKDGVGLERNWGSSTRAAKLAVKEVGKDAVCAVQGVDVLWMRPADADYFRSLVGDFKITNTASSVIDHAEKQSVSSNQFAGAERVRHAKLGEGSVIHRAEGRVLVQFDGQKKPTPVVPSFLETL